MGVCIDLDSIEASYGNIQQFVTLWGVESDKMICCRSCLYSSFYLHRGRVKKGNVSNVLMRDWSKNAYVTVGGLVWFVLFYFFLTNHLMRKVHLFAVFRHPNVWAEGRDNTHRFVKGVLSSIDHVHERTGRRAYIRIVPVRTKPNHSRSAIGQKTKQNKPRRTEKKDEQRGNKREDQVHEGEGWVRVRV